MNGLWNEKKTTLLFWLFFGINFAAVLIRWLYGAFLSCPIYGWGFTEFLINFQGGYVRRGLLGEILHYFCVNTGCSPNYIVYPLCLFCFVGFFFFMCKIIKELQFCWLVLLTNYGIFGADLIRKDYMIFLLLIAALWLYSHIRQHALRFFSPLFIIVVMLHFHEASFFYCVPVYFLILFSDKKSFLSFAEKVGQVVVITVTMGIICLCKGDKTTVDAIVNSWQVVYPETYHQLSTASLAAIGWDSFSTFSFHFEENFVHGTIPYSGFILRPIALMVVLFLMVRVGLNHYLKAHILLVDRFIYISLILLLTLVPMFTVLSCDFRRVVFYWVISSIIAFFNLKNERIFLMNTSLSQNGVVWIRNLILKPCKGRTLCILFLIFGIPFNSNALYQYGPPPLSLMIRAAGK